MTGISTMSNAAQEEYRVAGLLESTFSLVPLAAHAQAPTTVTFTAARDGITTVRPFGSRRNDTHLFTRFSLLFALMVAFFTLFVSPAQADTASDIKALQSAVAALQITVSNQQNTINSQTTTISTLQSQVSTLRGLTSSFSKVTDTTRTDGKKGTELYITGMNVHIVDGSGYTDDGTTGQTSNTQLFGLGNLTIGYNKKGNQITGDFRTGSHNLIVGDCNSYSCYGGLVAGYANTVTGIYCSATGGRENTASGRFSSVTGGFENKAVGTGTGQNEEATTVSGGSYNTANGYESSISGGYGITESSSYGWAGGSYHSP